MKTYEVHVARTVDQSCIITVNVEEGADIDDLAEQCDGDDLDWDEDASGYMSVLTYQELPTVAEEDEVTLTIRRPQDDDDDEAPVKLLEVEDEDELS